MSSVRPLRCAIYTRKSSEEGLEQEFNSLHAQRDACAAFITSQRHEGWKPLPAHYDDGGYSGGSMERPALKQLLTDIAAKRVDVVVVYKIDRLTRSLLDFAKMVEVFDKAGVSFVSVTQQFNTTTSMGRLTLNVLLSFAQFEREVTGERIRDKIAASKRKGMWMGGFVPLGYTAKDRTLVPIEAEADLVRRIFRLYLELGTVAALKDALDKDGLLTKTRAAKGRSGGGRPFSRGHLYRILTNPLYRGRIHHKGETFEGQHPALVDEETWNAVQDLLEENRNGAKDRLRAREPALLAGLLFDAHGEKLASTHATKAGKRYRYYVTASALQVRGGGRAGDPGATAEQTRRGARSNDADATPQESETMRLPAAEIERSVIDALISRLVDGAWVTRQVAAIAGATGVDAPLSLAKRKAIAGRGHILAETLQAEDRAARRPTIIALVDRIVVHPDALAIHVRRTALMPARGERSPEGLRSNSAGQDASSLNVDMSDTAGDAHNLAPVEIIIPMTIRRRGVEMQIITPSDAPPASPDPALTKALAQAHRWWRDLVDRRYPTVRDLALAYGTNDRYVARIIELALLPSPLQAAVLNGTEPPGMRLNGMIKPGRGSAARGTDEYGAESSRLQVAV